MEMASGVTADGLSEGKRAIRALFKESHKESAETLQKNVKRFGRKMRTKKAGIKERKLEGSNRGLKKKLEGCGWRFALQNNRWIFVCVCMCVCVSLTGTR